MHSSDTHQWSTISHWTTGKCKKGWEPRRAIEIQVTPKGQMGFSSEQSWNDPSPGRRQFQYNFCLGCQNDAFFHYLLRPSKAQFSLN